MNKLIASLTILMAAGTVLAACQSNRYKITGTAGTLQDGDTLFLVDDFYKYTPIDTVIVKDGKFELEGTADSTYLCLLYSNRRPEVSIPFFIEPGTIRLSLSDNPMKRRVSGSSPTNNKWQELNDSAMSIGRRINMIAAYVHSNRLSADELAVQMKKHDELSRQFRKLVIDYARRNTDNEFGYFLLTYYDSMTPADDAEGLADAGTKLELIRKMPRKMQERPAMKAVVARLERMRLFAEGGKITDFEMNGIDGKPIGIMSEIGKNRITVIDFWASWCGPCRAEMPDMVRMYEKYKDKGLGIFGISLDSRQKDWEDATRRLGIRWPQVSDLQGWNNAAARMFSVQSIPQTIIVDSDGVILKKGLRGAELEAFVDSQLR